MKTEEELKIEIKAIQEEIKEFDEQMEKLNDKILKLYGKIGRVKEGLRDLDPPQLLWRPFKNDRYIGELKVRGEIEETLHLKEECVEAFEMELKKIKTPSLGDVFKIFYKECKDEDED
jgi:chromosome segregation ATPase